MVYDYIVKVNSNTHPGQEVSAVILSWGSLRRTDMNRSGRWYFHAEKDSTIQLLTVSICNSVATIRQKVADIVARG